MSIKVERLATQIDQLLACVYSPSLQKFAEVVQRCNEFDLALWRRYSGEKLDYLVDIIMKGLEHDQHAIGIIECLASCCDLRDLMLKRTPHLLDGLIRASLANERSFEKYSAAVTSLLTPAMRTQFVLPSSIASYFLALIQSCIEDNAKVLRQIEAMLRENGGHLLRSISQHQRYNLTSHLGNLLGTKDSKAMVLAISCLASISLHSGQDSSTLEDARNTASLFAGDKGQKVLRLAFGIMNAQLFEDCDLDMNDRREECLVLENVAKALDKQTVKDWLHRKDGIAAMKKTLDKLALQMDTDIIKNVTGVLSTILQGADAKIKSVADVALRICSRAVNHLLNKNPCIDLTESFCRMIDFENSEESKVPDLFRNMLVIAAHSIELPNSWSSRLELECYISAVKALRASEQAKKRLRPLITEGETKCLLNNFARSSNSVVSGSDRVYDFQKHMCRLSLELLISRRSSGDADINVEPIEHLLEKLTTIPQSCATKALVWTQNAQSLSLPQIANTPHSGLGSRNWREKLLCDMQSEAAHQHTVLISRVDTICRDLERRAEINEEPLRILEAELSKVTDLANRLQSQLMEAHADLQQRDTENQNAYEERQRLEGAISELIQETELGNNRVRSLEQQEEGLKHQYETLLADSHKEKARFEEMNHIMRTELEESEQKAENLQDRLTKCAEENSRFEQDIQILQEKFAKTHEQRIGFEGQIVGLEQAITNSEEVHRKQLEDVRDNERSLQEQLDSKSACIATLEGRTNDLEEKLASYVEKEVEWNSALMQTRQMADDKLTLQREDHEAAHKVLQDEVTLAKTQFADLLRKSNMEKSALKQALSKIKSSYEKRCEEFQKAQDLSRRLMAVMGGNNNPSPNSPLHGLGLTATESPTTPIAAVKRAKNRPSSAAKRIGQSYTQDDLTEDYTFDEADKENQMAQQHDRQPANRTDDSLILSELSGLGI